MTSEGAPYGNAVRCHVIFAAWYCCLQLSHAGLLRCCFALPPSLWLLLLLLLLLLLPACQLTQLLRLAGLTWRFVSAILA